MHTILLVENNLALLEDNCKILELANYKVFTASNAILGVELALSNVPDLIICDMVMPVKDGYEMLDNIRNIIGLAHIPFIFLIALIDKSDYQKARRSNTEKYLSVPFREKALLEAVKTQLSGL